MPSKYQPIIDVKKANPRLSWTEAAREAGFKEGNFTSNGSGGVKLKSNRKKQRITRDLRERVYTTDAERANAARIRKAAKEQSESSMHQHAYGPHRRSIGEHGKALSAGGTNADLNTVSDPVFKEQKDSIEREIYRTYGNPEKGGKYTVDINDVTGYTRAVKSRYYNEYQNVSQQPGFDIGPDAVLERVNVGGLPKIRIVDGKTQIVLPFMTGMDNPPLGGFKEGERLPTSSAPTEFSQPSPLGGFDMSQRPGPTSTANKLPAFKPPSVYTSKNGNGNGNGNGSPPPNGSNGGNGDYMDVVDNLINNPTQGLLPLQIVDGAMRIGLSGLKTGVGLATGLAGGLRAAN